MRVSIFIVALLTILFSFSSQAQIRIAKPEVIMLRTTNGEGSNGFMWWRNSVRQTGHMVVPAGKKLVITDISGQLITYNQTAKDRYFAVSFQSPTHSEAAYYAKRWMKIADTEILPISEHFAHGLIFPSEAKLSWSVLGTASGYVEISLYGYME